MYYKRVEKYCENCGGYSGKFELCNECYHLAKEEYIIKNEQGRWIKNIRKNNEYKFYDEKKIYKLRESLLNEFEMRFFNIVRHALKKKYVIIPQINLQSIVETDTNTRNDELFRNIDFGIFYANEYKPFLMIEINGQQHYTNEYVRERDKSVKQILDKVGLPLLTIDVKDMKVLQDRSLFDLMAKVIKYLNPNFFQRLFGKEVNKMDLSWTKEFIKEELNKQEQLNKANEIRNIKE